jgi:hypothetical protein
VAAWKKVFGGSAKKQGFGNRRKCGCQFEIYAATIAVLIFEVFMPPSKLAFRLLCQRGVSPGPASTIAITAAEAVLAVKFPAQYREFLEEFGAILTEGLEIYGLIDISDDDQKMWQDVVDVSKQLRGWDQAGTERNGFLPISDDGAGVYFFLDTLQTDGAAVWAIGPGIEKAVANSFHQFAIDYTEGNIAL